MSVKVAAFKKLPLTEQYACSVLEVKEWAKGLADLRIDFGTHKSFQFDSRYSQRPKIRGTVVASISIDRQLKPAIFFYSIQNSQYPEQAKKVFLERILIDLKKWLADKLSNYETDIIGHETMLIELKGVDFEVHRLRSL
jgi:hypothetical protein